MRMHMVGLLAQCELDVRAGVSLQGLKSATSANAQQWRMLHGPDLKLVSPPQTANRCATRARPIPPILASA
jgi:hypothetical protein